MFGVTQIPPEYHHALDEFDGVFHDDRNRSSFRSLVSALIHSESQWTIAGLSRGISQPDAKCRKAYDYFLNHADWSAQALAQQLIEYALEQQRVGPEDHLLIHTDDTHVGKSGNATDGVADLHNPATGEREWGNKFVTSCLQIDDIYVPYQAQMYIPEHLSDEFEEPFKTKLEIAVEDILEPLQLPAGAACTVVADNAYMAAGAVSDICNLGYDVVTRIQTDRRIQPPDRFGKRNVNTYAEMLEYEEVNFSVRGEEYTYLAADSPVFIPKLGSAKLVVTEDIEEDDGDRRYYVSTNLDLSAVEILRAADHRWNIETLHQQANAKFGFDQYELETKTGIERFLQLVCVAWTVTVLASDTDESLWGDPGGLAARLDQAKHAYLLETVDLLWERVDPSLPRAERRERLLEEIRELSWDSLSIFLIPCLKSLVQSNN